MAKIAFYQNTPVLEGETYFTKGIDKDLRLTPHPDSSSNGINTKFQTVGNCTWASGKLLMCAAAYADLKQKGISDNSINNAYKFYKAFTTHDRQEGVKQIKEWLNNKDLTDDTLKGTYLGKKLPTREEVLVSILANATSQRDLKLVDELKEFITPNILEKSLQNCGNEAFANLISKFKER